MKFRHVVAVFGLATLFAACEDECKRGDACDKSCAAGEVAQCVAKGICSCVADGAGGAGGGGGGGGAGAAGGGGGECAAAVAGDLRINEVLMDGDEFIELVNNAEHPVSVGGLIIRSTKGASIATRVELKSGCMPARGAVAMYPNAALWVWDPVPASAPAYQVKAFGFHNTNDFVFELVRGEEVLDTFAGPGSLIDADVSVNRSPDGTGDMLAKHDEVAPGRASSPAACANGGRFVEGCAALPDNDGGVGGAGGGGGECDAPAMGELRINEVLIDAPAPDDENEFIELLNTTDRPLALGGLVVRSKKGLEDPSDWTTRATFADGCMPARGVVAMYKTEARWQWDPMPAPLPTFDARAFGFNNTSNFAFQVVAPGEIIIDTFAGEGALIVADKSLNRSPDGAGDAIVRHDQVSDRGLATSPAACANGGRFVEDCAATPPPDGGPGPGDAGPPDMGPPPDPPHVWIQEVLYSLPGDDTGKEFIEIGGLAGTVLDGVAIRTVNGSDNAASNPIPIVGTIPESGVFVVADNGAMDPLRPLANFFVALPAIQNGPDSVQLVFGRSQQLIDALAYGAFGAAPHAGEGTPAPAARDGQSLSRNPEGADTNDNAADFTAGAPSPGVR